ncbi:SRPBCC family protein [Amycolatopsis aidingensis]|uniref:SRPBCC family protein n=1 Tax=Amycolatopsis aidingensis TaxID=2842453 RepID=UPI001C0B76D3|nr:SRPBCC domain-containing protein [Amycolatopsis aidingensis]
MTGDSEAPHVEVTIAAPPERVWRALRDPDLIRRWHGWDGDGLEDEVRAIYVDGVTEEIERQALTFGGHDRFSLHTAADGGTVVRLTRAPRGADPDWDAYYEDTGEGWITFLVQLRFALERQALAERRTLMLQGRLAGEGHPADELGLAEAGTLPLGSRYRATLPTGDEFHGEVYARTENQRVFTVDSLGEGLLVVVRQPVTVDRPHGGAQVVLTAYHTPAGEFAELADRWREWWSGALIEP